LAASSRMYNTIYAGDIMVSIVVRSKKTIGKCKNEGPPIVLKQTGRR